MVSAVSLIEFERHGELAVADMPFPAVRVFILAPGRHGDHAHRQCSQMLIGDADVLVNRGDLITIYSICGLLVPPRNWIRVYCRNFVTVLCDRPYEADDYIRNYSDFMKCA